MTAVSCYEIFEIELTGPAEGNPFIDVTLEASFQYRNRVLVSEGFYDGKGVYRIRIMPDQTGEWRYVTRSNRPELDGLVGTFQCIQAKPGVHGPVSALDMHFTYADGTRYVPVGTTCYAWAHQGTVLENKTLETLKGGIFNKLRMCVFPKHYTYNHNEPDHFAFERSGGGFDFSRPNPAFWQHFEKLIGELAELNIEADLILFHPYDRWGFADMGSEADDRYLRTIVARLSAYRNVWWSLANEFDFLPQKKLSDWDRFFHILQEYDPHHHLRSIHQCVTFYNHSLPWVTHASVQHWDTNRVPEWRSQYRKPVVVDECGYEGTIEEGWGNFSPQEHVRKFWTGFCRGGYVGHGETYYIPEEILWWSKGGVLRGESPDRIQFLRRIIEAAPAGLEPTADWFCIGSRCKDEYFLLYLDAHQPRVFTYDLPEGDFSAEIIDTWEMTITPAGKHRGKAVVTMPGKPYLAVRFIRQSH